MTPRERIQKLFTREPIDTMPAFSGQGMVTIHAVEQMGIRFPQVHTSADLMARSAMTTAEMFGFESVIIPYDLCSVPEAMGRGVSLYEEAEEILYPTVPTKWERMEDVAIPEDFLQRGRMPLVDEAFSILASHAKDGRFALGAYVLGPFTMAGQVMELDVLLKGLKKDKERVQAFLTDMTQVVIQVGRHYQALGADYVSIREMGSGTDIISPRMWKMLVQPNLEQVFSALESPTVLHICGSTDLIIEMMAECGADALSVDHKNTLTTTRDKLGDHTLILGNFDAYTALGQMEAAEVPGVIKKCIDDGVDAVWPGCDIWPDVKRENIEAYIGAVHEYGRAPSPAVGRTS